MFVKPLSPGRGVWGEVKKGEVKKGKKMELMKSCNELFNNI
jgi:hypothetical protein